MVQEIAAQSQAERRPALLRRQQHDRLFSGERRDSKSGDLLVGERQNLFRHAQLFQDRPVDRVQEIPADLFPREQLLVDQCDRIASPGQRNGRGATCRARPYDGDIKPFHDRSSAGIRAKQRKGKKEKSSKWRLTARENNSLHSANVNALFTDRGASVRVITFRVKRRVSSRIP